MKKLLAVILAAGSLFISSSVDAEIRTYEGTDEYVMSEFETIDVAKQRAKQKAERAAQEQAGVFVASDTEVVNSMVTKDEIRTMTCGILKIVESPEYHLEELAGGKSFIVRATVKAQIDTDDIEKWFKLGTGERSELVAQNIELQKAIAAQDAQIAELKRQISSKPQIANRPQDTERISAQFAAEDKVFLSNQQLAETGRFYYAGNFNGAITLCTKAIEFNPSNAMAYSIRGAVYYKLRDFNSAIADYNRAINLNPNDYRNFYNRGIAYVKLNDYRRAAQDFDSALRLNPNDEDSRYNCELCNRAIYYQS